MAIHMGEIIHKLVEEKGLKAKFVASYVSVSESTLFKIYHRPSVDIDKLIKFSQLFDVNLFLYYIEEEPLKSMFGSTIELLQKEIIELKIRLADSSGVVNAQRETIEAQKLTLSLYGKKKRNG